MNYNRLLELKSKLKWEAMGLEDPEDAQCVQPKPSVIAKAEFDLKGTPQEMINTIDTIIANAWR